MHILFLTDNFPPEVNAPASRTFEHCREWVKSGHRVTVVTCVPNFPKGHVYPGYRNRLWQQETLEGVRVVRVWSYITANEGFLKRIFDYQSFMVMAILASPFVRKADVVIGTSPQFFTACAAYAVSRLKRIPFVFELRDLWPESIKAVGAMRNSFVLRLLEKLELFLYRNATRIVSVTDSFKRNLAARGIDPDKIDVITNGIELSRFHPQSKDIQLVRHLKLEGKFVAGYIGTHGMAHSLETILDAADYLSRQPAGEAFRFILLGDGARKSALREKARQLALDNVIFIDSVPKEEVVKYWSLLDASIIHLKKADVFAQVIPSKLFESVGMGIPVLHGVAGESAKIVEREGAGLVFEPEDARQLCERLCSLKNDRALYDSLRVGCLNAAPHYDRAELAGQMLSLLENMVHGRFQESGRMRLLFINRYFYPDISATSQLLTELAEDLDARGDRVTVITGKTAYFDEEARLPAQDTYKGIQVRRVGFTRFGRSRTLGRLADYLSFWISALWAAARTKDQDCLVVLSDPPLLSVLAAMVRLVRPVKTICWLQDVFPEIAIRAEVLREGMIARFFRAMVRWSLRRMDQIVVIGRCMERYLLSQGLPARTITNIPNWADGERISPVTREDNEFLNRHNLQDRFVVMYSGNHGVVHEYEALVALIRETRYFPDICFCFVGEGAWKHKLMEIAKSEIWPHVAFLPYQPKAVLRSSLSAADVHLVSLRQEMEGLSIPSKIYGVLAHGLFEMGVGGI